MGFVLLWERLSIYLLFSGMLDQDLCFAIGRQRLSILFHCCKVCFQILFKETFSMLINLSGCSCAEDPCNLHAIIAILLIFLHKYLVFILCPSSFIYIIVWKTSQYNIPWSKRSSFFTVLIILLFGTLAVATSPVPKEAGIKNKLQ